MPEYDVETILTLKDEGTLTHRARVSADSPEAARDEGVLRFNRAVQWGRGEFVVRVRDVATDETVELGPASSKGLWARLFGK